MTKYSHEQRLKIVMDVLEKHMSIREARKLSGCNHEQVRRWIRRYELFGVEGIVLTHGSYTGEFKQHVIEYMHENHLSIIETSVLFGIPAVSTVFRWEHIYCEEGPQALHGENRGRKKNMQSDSQRNKK